MLLEFIRSDIGRWLTFGIIWTAIERIGNALEKAPAGVCNVIRWLAVAPISFLGVVTAYALFIPEIFRGVAVAAGCVGVMVAPNRKDIAVGILIVFWGLAGLGLAQKDWQAGKTRRWLACLAGVGGIVAGCLYLGRQERGQE